MKRDYVEKRDYNADKCVLKYLFSEPSFFHAQTATSCYAPLMLGNKETVKMLPLQLWLSFAINKMALINIKYYWWDFIHIVRPILHPMSSCPTQI